MDPSSIQYQELLHYPQGSKFHMGQGVIMMPLASLEVQSPTDLSEHVTTQIITPEQLQQVAAIRSNRTQERPVTNGSVDLGGVDESLTDLQPEESDSEEEEELHKARERLTREQTKLEFMAAVNLVPPAVLEDIQRRQKLCRAEYGNWWDRQHSTDFCLVPKNQAVHNPVSRDSPDEDHYDDQQGFPLVVGEDQTQVAAGPDAESTVEQITYLTSWPATAADSNSSSTPCHAPVDAVAMPTSSMSMLGAVGVPMHQGLHHQQQRHVEESIHIAFQPVRDYSTSGGHQ